jgi:hypothetical protein
MTARLTGESACPTKTPALAHQGGTDALVCQHVDPGDSFTAFKEAPRKPLITLD